METGNMAQISVCGSDCGACSYYGSLCKGCSTCEGKVFHAPKGSACPIYDCAVNQKHFAGCGTCGQAPCQVWRDTRDPQLTDEAFEQSIRERLKMLQTSIDKL